MVDYELVKVQLAELVSNNSMIDIFECFKRDELPCHPSYKDAVDVLVDFFKVYKRIGDFWKLGCKFEDCDKALFDNYIDFFRESFPNRGGMPAICRQLPSAIKFSEFLEHGVDDSSFVGDITCPSGLELAYVVGGTLDYVDRLWDVFYEASMQRIPENLNVHFFLAVPDYEYELTKARLCDYKNVSVVSVGQIGNAALSTDSHSYKSSTRFYLLAKLILSNASSSYVLTDMDSVMPSGFDFSFPDDYGLLNLRFWYPEFPFHWRNVSAGFMWLRSSKEVSGFACNLIRSLNAYQLTQTERLCGDQISLECALRFIDDPRGIKQFGFKLESWFGTLEDKRRSMQEYFGFDGKNKIIEGSTGL